MERGYYRSQKNSYKLITLGAYLDLPTYSLIMIFSDIIFFFRERLKLLPLNNIDILIQFE